MIQVSAAIIWHSQEKKILLAQRPEGKHLAGFWEFPGGKIETLESPEQALKRELKEELHLDIQVDYFLGRYEYRYSEELLVTLHVFVVKALSEAKVSQDVQAFKWHLMTDINKDNLAPADVQPYLDFVRKVH